MCLSFLTVFVALAGVDACPVENKHARGQEMESTFGSWIGRPVIVRLGLGRIILRVRGTFLEDRDQTLLVRPEIGSDVEIPKTKVLAIEETRRWSKPVMTFL